MFFIVKNRQPVQRYTRDTIGHAMDLRCPMCTAAPGRACYDERGYENYWHPPHQARVDAYFNSLGVPVIYERFEKIPTIEITGEPYER